MAKSMGSPPKVALLPSAANQKMHTAPPGVAPSLPEQDPLGQHQQGPELIPNLLQGPIAGVLTSSEVLDPPVQQKIENDDATGAAPLMRQQQELLPRNNNSGSDNTLAAGAAAAGPFPVGSKLEYHSATLGGWIPCHVTKVGRENGGAVQINVKLGYWFTPVEQVQKLRPAVVVGQSAETPATQEQRCAVNEASATVSLAEAPPWSKSSISRTGRGVAATAGEELGEEKFAGGVAPPAPPLEGRVTPPPGEEDGLVAADPVQTSVSASTRPSKEKEHPAGAIDHGQQQHQQQLSAKQLRDINDANTRHLKILEFFQNRFDALVQREAL